MIRPEPDSSPLARLSAKIEDEYFARLEKQKAEERKAAIDDLRRKGLMKPGQTFGEFIAEQLGLAPSSGFVPDNEPLDLDPIVAARIEDLFERIGRVLTDEAPEEEIR